MKETESSSVPHTQLVKDRLEEAHRVMKDRRAKEMMDSQATYDRVKSGQMSLNNLKRL